MTNNSYFKPIHSGVAAILTIYVAAKLLTGCSQPVSTPESFPSPSSEQLSDNIEGNNSFETGRRPGTINAALLQKLREQCAEAMKALEQLATLPAVLDGYSRLDPTTGSDIELYETHADMPATVQESKKEALLRAVAYFVEPEFVKQRREALTVITENQQRSALGTHVAESVIGDARIELQAVYQQSLADELTIEQARDIETTIKRRSFPLVHAALMSSKALLEEINELAHGRDAEPSPSEEGFVTASRIDLLEAVKRYKKDFDKYACDKALWLACRDPRFREALDPLASRRSDGSLNYLGFDEIKASYLVSYGNRGFSGVSPERALEAIIRVSRQYYKWLDVDFIETEEKFLATRDDYPLLFGRESSVAGKPTGHWATVQFLVDRVVERNHDMFMSRVELKDSARRQYLAEHGASTAFQEDWVNRRLLEHQLPRWQEEPLPPYAAPLPPDTNTFGLDPKSF